MTMREQSGAHRVYDFAVQRCGRVGGLFHDNSFTLMSYFQLLSGASFSEVLDECLESVRERNLRLPTEDRFRAADVGVPLLGVVLRQRSVFQFNVLCHRFSD
eukprot:Selendium_serpulae@DN6411_c0_g1_i12.p1